VPVPHDDLRAAFDREAQSWHRRHGSGPLVRLVRRWRTRRLLRACRLDRGARVLDVGCGTGEQLLELLPRIAEATGIDISPAMIARARALAAARGADDRLRFAVLAIEEAEPPELGLFDAVLFVGSLEHVADQRLALARAASLLRPGGRLAVVAPHPAHPRSWWNRLQSRRGRIPPFRHPWSAELRAMATAAGLGPVAGDRLERLENAVSFCLLGSTLAVFERPRASTRAAPTRAP
jgi:SAM-dependent methyltransferase